MRQAGTDFKPRALASCPQKIGIETSLIPVCCSAVKSRFRFHADLADREGFCAIAEARSGRRFGRCRFDQGTMSKKSVICETGISGVMPHLIVV
jgi:hypothetical protein